MVVNDIWTFYEHINSNGRRFISNEKSASKLMILKSECVSLQLLGLCVCMRFCVCVQCVRLCTVCANETDTGG